MTKHNLEEVHKQEREELADELSLVKFEKLPQPNPLPQPEFLLLGLLIVLGLVAMVAYSTSQFFWNHWGSILSSWPR